MAQKQPLTLHMLLPYLNPFCRVIRIQQRVSAFSLFEIGEVGEGHFVSVRVLNPAGLPVQRHRREI